MEYKYLEKLGEIDKWIAENFQLTPGGRDGITALQYNIAKEVARKLWFSQPSEKELEKIREDYLDGAYVEENQKKERRAAEWAFNLAYRTAVNKNKWKNG